MNTKISFTAGYKALNNAKELDVLAGIEFAMTTATRFRGLAASVAMTVIMEAYKNDWFVNDVVVLPALPAVREQQRFQSGATQVAAFFGRHWQRLEKRRRFLDGEIETLKGNQKPPGTQLRSKP
jgi:hypothetical protein